MRCCSILKWSLQMACGYGSEWFRLDVWRTYGPNSCSNQGHCGLGGSLLHRLEFQAAPKMESLQVLWAPLSVFEFWALLSVFDYHHCDFYYFSPITSNSNSVCCNSELCVSPDHYALQRQIWLHLLCEADVQKTSKWFYILKYLVCKYSSNDWIIFIKPAIAFGLPSSRAWTVSEIHKNIQ